MQIFPIYLFSFSADGLIVGINDFFLDDLGFSREEVEYTLKLEDLLRLGGRIFLQTHLYPLLKMHGNANEIYLALRKKDGSELPVLFNANVSDNDGRWVAHCAGLQISKRDSYENELLASRNLAEKTLSENPDLALLKSELDTTQKQLENRLRELSRSRFQQIELNKVLSHDLQEPLRKISLFGSLLVAQNPGLNAKALATIEKMTQSVLKIRHLLSELEKLNSLEETTSIRNVIRPAEIFANIEDAIAIQKLQVKIRKQLLDGDPESLFLESDLDLICTLFNELVFYALRYRNSEGEFLSILITVDKIRSNVFLETKGRYEFQDCLRFVFSDDGMGFVQSREPFKIFERSQLGTDRMDVGLAYCRKIVEVLQGEITLTSDKTKGTIFTIVLPVKAIDSN